MQLRCIESVFKAALQGVGVLVFNLPQETRSDILPQMPPDLKRNHSVLFHPQSSDFLMNQPPGLKVIICCTSAVPDLQHQTCLIHLEQTERLLRLLTGHQRLTIDDWSMQITHQAYRRRFKGDKSSVFIRHCWWIIFQWEDCVTANRVLVSLTQL